MRRLTILFAALFLYGGNAGAEADYGSPGESTINKEINDNVKDVTKKRAPKWVIDYTGDMNGTIQGGIMSAVSMSSATKVGGSAMTKDMKGKAAETFMLTILTIHTPPTATMALTLADGTRCVDANTSTVKIIDKNSRSFNAEANGALVCGDRKITYTAKMNKKP